MESDRRKRNRVYCSGDILINGEPCKAIDVSDGGLYVYTRGLCNSIKQRSMVEVTFPLRNNTDFTVKAIVKHKHTDVGMGLKFVDLDAEQKKILTKIIESAARQAEKTIVKRQIILLIEDNRMTREMYKSRLYMEGFSVIEARDGLEAIEALKTSRPALIVFDLNMEKIDGLKVLLILKASRRWRDIPVIVFSAHVTKEVVDKVVAAGADEFLPKMITSPRKLAATVKSVLGRNNGSRG